MRAPSSPVPNHTWAAAKQSALLIGLFTPTGALIAQSAPAISARSMMETGPSAACALAISGVAGVSWDAVRLQVLTPPMSWNTQRPVTPVAAIDVASSARRTWRVRAAGAAGASTPDCAAQSSWSRGWIAASRAIPRGGMSLAFGLKSLSALDPTRDRQGLAASLWQQRGAGRWDVEMRAFDQRQHGMTWFTRTIMRPDSMPSDSGSGGWTRFFRPTQVQDSSAVAQRSNLLALSTRWRRDVGRASLDFTIGGTGVLGRTSAAPSEDTSFSRSSITAHSRVQWWARADTRVTLNRFADLLVGVAALPSQPASGIRGGRVASVGLAFATGARATIPVDAADAGGFEVRRVGPFAAADSSRSDSVTVRLRLRDDRARRVDVSGEQLGWQPIPLTKVDAQWWEADVRMRVGTYRMSIRRDGKRWTAPPGFPVLRDEFGGEVALVTVR